MPDPVERPEAALSLVIFLLCVTGLSLAYILPLEGRTMNYAKALAAVVATVLSGVIAALTGDGSVDVIEWVNVAILAAGALSVFSAPNVPGAAITKTVLAVVTAVLTLAVSLIAGGLTITEWLQLGMAALGALGVYAVPNSGAPEIVDHPA